MENSKDNKLFDHIKSTLEDYEPDYSPQSWDRFSKMLDEKQSKPKPFSWTNWLNGFISGALIALLFVGSFFLYFKPESDFILNHSNGDTGTQPRIQVRTSSSLNKESNSGVSKEFDRYNRNYMLDSMNVNNQEFASDDELAIATLDKNSIGESNEMVAKNTYLITSKYHFSFALNRNAMEQDLPSNFFKNRSRIDKKKKKSNFLNFKWDLPKFSGTFQSDMYKNFIGPDRVKVGFEPGLMSGSFQDKLGLNYTGSFMLQGPIASNILVGIGFQYSNYRWERKNVFGSYVQGVASDTSLQFVVDSIHINKGEWNYLEIPLSLSLDVVSFKKSSIHLNSSFSAVLLRRERYQFDRIIGQSKFSTYNQPEKWANYQLLGNFRIGLEYRYHINDRWSLWVEPYYKQYISGMGETAFKPKNFGVGFGVVYQFNLHK